MKYRLLWYITLTIGLLFPLHVSAQCSNTEKIRLSSLAQNVTVTYDYIEENGQVSFYIIMTNLQPEFRVRDVNNQRDYAYTSSELVLYGYIPNTNYRFDIYGTGECSNKRLYSHYITLPGYNPYYSDPICIGVTNSICQKWIHINYDYNTFINEVSKLKQEQPVEPAPEKEKEVLGIYDYLIIFFVNYYYIILPIIIIVCLTIIYIQRKKESLF